MESENLHHQHQIVGSSSSFPISPSYGVSSNHSWTPTAPSITLNSSEFNFNPNYTGDILHSRQKYDMLASPQNSSMIQDWANSDGSLTTHSCHGLHLPNIKDDLSESITRFSDLLSDSSSSVGDSHQLPRANYLEDNEQRDLNDLSQKLLLNTISSGFPMFSAGPEFYSSIQNCSIPRNSFPPSRGRFSLIYPSINISIPSSFDFDMNLEALDLLNPARSSRSSRFSYPSEDHHDNLGIYKEISPPFGIHHHHNLQQSNQRPAAYSPSKISSPFPTEITEAKRPSILLEAKATAAKKSRLESRASCPPFKVRKEKLGDRIAALQQLVAPFGKWKMTRLFWHAVVVVVGRIPQTDTASVLMEAIGYIKLLQNQVETLSVPYMKSSRNKTSRSKHGGSTMENVNEEEAQWDLRSRGLCLVPLSCMSYVTSDVVAVFGHRHRITSPDELKRLPLTSLEARRDLGTCMLREKY